METGIKSLATVILNQVERMPPVFGAKAMNSIPALVLQQRIRNRIIEYFNGASQFDEVAKWGAFEQINMWEDLAPNGWLEDFHCAPVFSTPEQQALKDFCSIWNRAADATNEDIFSAQKLKQSDKWVHFVRASKANFALFMERGRFSEDIEAF